MNKNKYDSNAEHWARRQEHLTKHNLLIKKTYSEFKTNLSHEP